MATVDSTRNGLTPQDPRLARALFTLRESAAYLDLPVSTVHRWARPQRGTPLLTILPGIRGGAAVPFVGFAEAFVLGSLRRAGVPLQRIRPAVARLNEEFGLEHALASERVYTDGAEVVFDYAERNEQAMLAVVRTGQRQFADIIRAYLKRITYGGDGWATQLNLPAYRDADVWVDPRRAFGQPLLVHGGARVEDLVDRFQAGDGLSEIAVDFGVPAGEVEDVIRVALRLPA